MLVDGLHIRHFRCFSHITLTFDTPITIIHGKNGSGKTSLAEALYYAGYLRSFRTSHSTELVKNSTDHFSVQLSGTDTLQAPWRITIGYQDGKRKVRVNEKAVQSYKELLKVYRVITTTADDIQLIAGGPEYRRMFMDQGLLLIDAAYGQTVRAYRRALQQRNALLAHGRFNADAYWLWTEKLWESARIIEEKRTDLLSRIEQHMNQLCARYIAPDMTVTMTYASKGLAIGTEYASFKQSLEKSVMARERRYQRTLWGPHVHDCTILFNQQHARTYTSRGQQKLLALLLKLALLMEIAEPVLVVLDDFITDFDEEITQRIIAMLAQMPHQLVITTPRPHAVITDALSDGVPYRVIDLHQLFADAS